MTSPSSPQDRRRRATSAVLRALVADRGVLSGLPEELRRWERRRRRRPDRTSGSAGLSAAARSRRLVAQPVLHVARRGRRVRRCEPDRRRPGIRHDCRLRRAGCRRARAWHPSHDRHRPQPFLRPAPLVPRSARRRAWEPGAGAIHLPRRARSARRAPSEQLAVSVRRTGLDSRPGRSVVPALVRG